MITQTLNSVFSLAGYTMVMFGIVLAVWVALDYVRDFKNSGR